MRLKRLMSASQAQTNLAHLNCDTRGQGTATHAMHMHPALKPRQRLAAALPAAGCLQGGVARPAGCLPNAIRQLDPAGTATQGTLCYKPWLTCSAWNTVASAATIPKPMASLGSLGASSEMKPRQMRKNGRLLNSPPCWSALRCRTLAITPIVLASRGEPPPWAATGQEEVIVRTNVSVNLCPWSKHKKRLGAQLTGSIGLSLSPPAHLSYWNCTVHGPGSDLSGPQADTHLQALHAQLRPALACGEHCWMS